jgi:glutathione peroxidase-family protein
MSISNFKVKDVEGKVIERFASTVTPEKLEVKIKKILK